MKKLIATALMFTLSPLAIAGNCPSILEFDAKRLRADDRIAFCDAFAGKAVLVVNTASRCGYTPQFKGLEALYQKYKDDGLAIVGFPSNDFRQEHDDAEKTAEVCYVNYGVTFDMVEEGAVTGADANKLFQRLRERTGESPSWNFNKYLISPDGTVVEHFPSSATPLGGELERAIRATL